MGRIGNLVSRSCGVPLGRGERENLGAGRSLDRESVSSREGNELDGL